MTAAFTGAGAGGVIETGTAGVGGDVSAASLRPAAPAHFTEADLAYMADCLSRCAGYTPASADASLGLAP